MQQFHSAGCHIVGVQETRHRHIVGSSNEFYHIFGHPADARGQDGIQLWISKSLKVGPDCSPFSREFVRIVASAPNYIVAKLKVSKWSCVVISCRAPHSGRPQSEIIAFWSHINGILQRIAHHLPIFFCGDANAHLGEIPSIAVGQLQATIENSAGKAFHEWMLRHDLFVPSTFEEWHRDTVSATHVSPNGHEVRIDYIALPRTVNFQRIESWVSEEIDLSITRCDHRAVLCKVDFDLLTPQRSTHVRAYQPDVQDLASNLQNEACLHFLHSAIATPPWHVDPHTSAAILTYDTFAATCQLAQPRSRWRRKSHISEATWELVDRKKLLFKQLKALKRTLRFTVLQVCFIGWKHQKQPQEALVFIVSDLPRWLHLHDQAVATTQSQLRIAAEAAKTAITEEDSKFYQSIAEQTNRVYTTEGLTTLWKQLRALLPKHRTKTQQVRRDIDNDLQGHFERLEAGTLIDKDDLRSSCYARNQDEQEQQITSQRLSLEELPTLVEVENLCLRQRPRKAPGPDCVPADLCRHGATALAPHLHSVLCKSLVYGIEPFDFKGGRLCSIYKGKGDPDDPAGYRGILLSNTFAKIGHAWARQRLLPTLLQRKTLGQLGGLPSQQTITGVQAVRLHGSIAQQKHLSSAVIFLDLKAAFHHMLRELIFATHNKLAVHVLTTFLDENDFDLHQIASDLDRLCSTEIQDIPIGLRRLLHDIHQHTWFVISQNFDDDDTRCTHTKRGTRPGSPLADIGFNLMMTPLLQEVHQALMESEDFVAGANAMGTFTPPIAWMDDVAISLATVTAPQLEPLIQYTLGAVHDAFRRRGLTLNLERGKSEIIVMFRGPGAVQCRTGMFDTDHSPTITATTDTHILNVKVTTSYKHLGVRFAMNLDYSQEVLARIGAARQAFEQLRKPIFQSAAIPVEGRIMLFQSLVLSRLFFGCAIWSQLSTATYKKIDAAIIAFYRRIFNKGFWSDEQTSDADFLSSNRLVSFRIFWAKHRLCFLQHLAMQGLTFHKTLLLAEFETGKGWLFEVLDDLQWLAQFRELPFLLPASRADWIEAWEQLRQARSWKRWISTAVRKHLEQEKIAWEIRTYHWSIRSELERFGMELVQPLDSSLPKNPSVFACSRCNATFASAQQLAVHAFRLHQVRADESYYVQTEICPGCLKNFHTTFRVVQHLRYRKNLCWDRIYGVRPPDVPGHVTLPEHLAGVHRLPAVRRHHGPLRPTSKQRDCLRIRQELKEVLLEGEPDFAWWDPADQPDLTTRCVIALNETLQTWICDDPATIEGFHNAFFHCLFSFEIPEFQAARIFIHWVEKVLPDFVPSDDVLHNMETLDEAHMSMLDDLHIWHLRSRYNRLTQQLDQLNADDDVPVLEQRPLAHDRAARQYPIRTCYSEMAEEELQRRMWRMKARPQRGPTPEQGPYYVIHMYAGRRRDADFHHHMARLVRDCGQAWASSIIIISLDTAIDERMNVHSELVWNWLLRTARAGRILGLLLGPPCETWSSARHETQLGEDGLPMRGPRPLRLSEASWGLIGLALRELCQLSTGSCLLLRGLWLCVPVALFGGAVLLEHPAPPYQEERASIFRTGLVLLLLRDGWLFKRHTFQQWRHGAGGVKPTSLLYANNSIPAVLDRMAIPGLAKPQTALIGKNDQGSFRTAIAKEYPSNLCACFAQSIWERISQLPLNCGGSGPDQMATEFAALSARVDPSMAMRPDYQPDMG